jgi:hypothetical protein
MRRLHFWLVAPMVIAAMALSGCIFLRSSSISDSAGKGNPISAQASDMGYLLLVPPGDVTEAAADQLMNSCPTGKLTDVQTEMNLRNFFSIVQQYTVTANGVCMQ